MTVWPWIFTATGVPVGGAAILTMITAGTWAVRSDRFQAARGTAEALAFEDPAELWKAMDAGVDPTDRCASNGNPTDHDTAKVPYPDVHDPDPGATMDGTEGRPARRSATDSGVFDDTCSECRSRSAETREPGRHSAALTFDPSDQ